MDEVVKKREIMLNNISKAITDSFDLYYCDLFSDSPKCDHLNKRCRYEEVRSDLLTIRDEIKASLLNDMKTKLDEIFINAMMDEYRRLTADIDAKKNILAGEKLSSPISDQVSNNITVTNVSEPKTVVETAITAEEEEDVKPLISMIDEQLLKQQVSQNGRKSKSPPPNPPSPQPPSQQPPSPQPPSQQPPSPQPPSQQPPSPQPPSPQPPSPQPPSQQPPSPQPPSPQPPSPQPPSQQPPSPQISPSQPPSSSTLTAPPTPPEIVSPIQEPIAPALSAPEPPESESIDKTISKSSDENDTTTDPPDHVQIKMETSTDPIIGPPQLPEVDCSIANRIVVMAYLCPAPNCNSILRGRAKLKSHLLEVHRIEDKRCLLIGCDASFRDLIALRVHVYRQHLCRGEPMLCTCVEGDSARSFRSYNRLKEHDWFAHQAGRFACPQRGCQFVANFRRLVYEHMLQCGHVAEVKQEAGMIGNGDDNDNDYHRHDSVSTSRHATSISTSKIAVKRKRTTRLTNDRSENGNNSSSSWSSKKR